MNSGCQPHPEAPSGHQRRVSFQAQADTWLITLSDIDIQNRPSSTQGPKPTPAVSVLFQAQADTWLITFSDIDIQNRPSPTQGLKRTPAESILFAAETWLTILSEIEIQNTEPASPRGKGERCHRLMLSVSVHFG